MLSARYPGFDAQRVGQHFKAGGFPSLTAAYKDLMFDVVAQQAAVSDGAVAEKAAAAKKVSKRGAARPRGRTSVGGGKARKQVGDPLEGLVRGAIEEAAAQNNVSFDWGSSKPLFQVR